MVPLVISDQNDVLDTINKVAKIMLSAPVYIILVYFQPNYYSRVQFFFEALESLKVLQDCLNIIVGDFKVPAFTDCSVALLNVNVPHLNNSLILFNTVQYNQVCNDS